MANKLIKPVDRALADVSRQIETVERQLRAMGHATSAPATVAPRVAVRKFFWDFLKPPARRQVVRSPRDLFDTPVNPLRELDDTPVTLPVAQPELFIATNAGGKLGQYLASAGQRPPKPQLRRVQNENRHRFYLWLGLSCVAVWLIYAVVK